MSIRASYTYNPWVQRLHSANQQFDDWHEKFRCKKLYDYYENFQWKGRTDSPQMNYHPYQLNLFHSTIKIKLASFLFQRPEFLITPEPGHSHWDIDFAVQSAQLKQDVLNTIVKNPQVKFARTLKRCALDSFFRFAMLEVGYAADWRNPLKDDPLLTNWEDPDQNEDKVRVLEQNEVPVNERFFVKRIKPWRFRASVSDAEDMEDFEWVGYWQYYFTDTLKKTPGIKFPKDYDGTTYTSSSIGSFSKDSSSGLFIANRPTRAICKVWHIWDQIARERRLLLDDYDNEDYELWSQPFERLPLIDLRWNLREEGFYPIPPSFYWLSSQDEINESREQIRSYRRRFTRKFYALQGQVDEEEKEKFVSGPDGVLITVKQVGAIGAIDNPEIGPTSENALLQAKDDFNIVSGTSAEARGTTDRETATSAQITNTRAQIRESAEQLDFTEFVALAGREILSQAAEKLVDGLWVKYSSNPSEGPLTDMQVNAPIFKYIKSQDLTDGYDFTVDVDVKNATPAAMEAESLAFTKFNAMLMQFPALSLSPVLIREAAYRCGYKNEQVIHQMQQVALLSMAAKASQAGASGQQIQQAIGGNSGGQNPADTAKAQMAQPNTNVIEKQITNQIQ